MTGFADLKVDYAALDSMASGIVRAAQAMDEKLNAMERRMETRKAEWAGEDSNAYDTARAGWDRAMADMINVLQEVATAVTRACTDYQAAEAANARRFTVR
jgi:6 kDa early secretory antigenic target